jgi:GR25 family glycosyltransferase involved in LPS biosynthesis
MNQHSYRYELITNEKGMFDNYIDMVYLITMEDSPRREHYMNQINKYIPHKNITIQYNKGFKLCKKNLLKQNTMYDINDAYYHVFLNVLQNNYKNIIIFEDDFFFDDTINQYIVDDIGKFITNTPYHLYNLGRIYHVSVPNLLSPSHLKVYYTASAHGVIYNRDYAYYFIKKYEKGIYQQPDITWNELSVIKYTYYKPLCFQLFENTENIQNWESYDYIKPIIKFLRLDKEHRFGFNIANILSYIVSFHVIFIFLYFYL